MEKYKAQLLSLFQAKVPILVCDVAVHDGHTNFYFVDIIRVYIKQILVQHNQIRIFSGFNSPYFFIHPDLESRRFCKSLNQLALWQTFLFWLQNGRIRLSAQLSGSAGLYGIERLRPIFVAGEITAQAHPGTGLNDAI